MTIMRRALILSKNYLECFQLQNLFVFEKFLNPSESENFLGIGNIL